MVGCIVYVHARSDGGKPSLFPDRRHRFRVSEGGRNHGHIEDERNQQPLMGGGGGS